VEVIVEAFVKFNSEITLLTVVQNNNPTIFIYPMWSTNTWDYQKVGSQLFSDKIYMAQDYGKKLLGHLVVLDFWSFFLD
jgi:phosphoribosylglycinamide formyltransferase 2